MTDLLKITNTILDNETDLKPQYNNNKVSILQI